MRIEFVGGAQTVTGSRHVVRTRHAGVLLDCGLWQGRRRESYERNRRLGFDPAKIDAVVLSHAHIDHSGALPMLTRNGWRGSVYATPATRDLCAVMLEDAAMIQASDARYLNKSIARREIESPPVEPLYDAQDVARALARMVSIPYRRRQEVAPGVAVTFHDAGHVLGSAVTDLEVEEGGVRTRIVFTGDLGRRRMPILRDPQIVDGADVLVTESTYGDRLHAPIEEMDDALAEVLRRAHARGGKVIVPSFALERAQEIVFSMKKLRAKGRMPAVPVYVDSPLTVNITEIFKRHPECYDAEARRALAGGDSPFEFDGLRYVSDVEESKALDASDRPSVIISASGMCEAGRVLHHLRAAVEDPKNLVLIVGFQAQHTLGRRLVEKRERVKIFGVERDRRAEVVVLNGFSAHADQRDLVEYAEATRERGRLRRIALVHGEPKAQDALRGKLAERGFAAVHAPAAGEAVEI